MNLGTQHQVFVVFEVSCSFLFLVLFYFKQWSQSRKKKKNKRIPLDMGATCNNLNVNFLTDRMGGPVRKELGRMSSYIGEDRERSIESTSEAERKKKIAK